MSLSKDPMLRAAALVRRKASRPLSTVWRGIIGRCHSPKDDAYQRYGAKGITVCDRWRASYRDFEADMGPKPTPQHQIDRIDCAGPYCPENCRWVTVKDQARNKRNLRYLEHGGERLPMIVWAERVGIGAKSMAERLAQGWSIERAVTQPPTASIRVPKPPKPPRKKSVRAMAAEHGISYCTVNVRMYNLGWSLEKALNTPVQDKTPQDPNSKSGRCRAVGLTLENVCSRMKRHGLTFEQALEYKPRVYTKTSR